MPPEQDKTLLYARTWVPALLLLFVQAVAFWRHLRRSEYLKAARTAIAEFCRSLCARYGPDDPVAKQLAQGTLERQMGIWRQVLLPLCVLVSANVAFIAFSSLTQRDRWMTPGEDAVYLAFYAVILLLDHLPWLLNTKTMGCWYSVCMLLIAIFVQLKATTEGDWTKWVHALLVRFFFSLLSPNDALVAFWNFVYSVAQVIHIGRSPTQLGQDGGLAQTGFRSANEFAFVLCCIMVVRVIVREAERHAVTFTKSRIELNAATSLLSSTCDAVLELDADLQIDQHAPKFADLVMRGSSLPLTGRSLADYMFADADRQQLLQTMSSPLRAEFPPVADVFRAGMRDSLSNRIDVDIYHVGFLAFGGLPRHLVGITERTDDPALGRPGHCPDATREAAGSAAAGAPPLPSEEVAVEVDVKQQGLPLVRWSAGFSLVVGRVAAGDSFLQLIDPRAEAHVRFMKWLQKALNMAQAKDPAEVEHFNSHRVQFRPHGESRAHGIRATCRIIFHWENKGDDEGSSSSSSSSSGSDGPSRFRISLSEFQRTHMGKQRHRRSRGSSAGSEGSGGSSGSDSSGSGRGTPSRAGAQHSGHISRPGAPGRGGEPRGLDGAAASTA